MDETRARLHEWRLAVAKLYLTAVSTVMPLLLVYWAIARPPPIFDVQFVFVGVCWLSFVVTRLFAPATMQAIIVIALLMGGGMFGPLVLGLSPGPFLSGVSAVLMAALVFGRRPSVALLVVFACWLLLVGALVDAGVFVTPSMRATDPAQFSNWGRLAIFTSLNTGLLAVVLTGLFDRMEDAWRATARAAESEKHEHAQRRLAEERAVEAQRLEAIGKLAGGVSHDFNNLLLVIMAWADMLPDAKSDAERKEGLEAIRSASTQAAQLTRQLVSFAKKSVVQPSLVDVDAFVFTMLKSLRRMVPDDVKIEHVVARLPRVLVDEAQLGQVVLNLVVNAGDAMPNGGTLTLATKVLEQAELPPEAPDPNARYVALIVKDTGSGMDEETRARVFEPFFTTKGPGRGTGLGLASVYGIVTQAKGFVKVDSQPGVGSTFTVALPVAPERTEHAVVPGASVAPAPARRGRVLLVEDNAQVRATMAAALRHAGLEPIEAGNAAEALSAARRHRGDIELLCTDAVMPGMPTNGLIEGFHQLFPRAPVLVCSGYVEEELVRRGIEEGAVAVLAKPFTADTLVAKVRSLLAASA